MKIKLVVFLVFCLFAINVNAAVIWTWNFDTESGILITDGNFSDTSYNHTFTITSFQVFQSVLPGNVGGIYVESQAPQGFIWNGTAPTQFFRSGGSATNGSNFFLDGFDIAYGLQPPTNNTIVYDPTYTSTVIFPQGVITLTPTHLIFLNGFE